MGVERAKDVSQANQLMNLRKVSTALPLFFPFLSAMIVIRINTVIVIVVIIVITVVV